MLARWKAFFNAHKKTGWIMKIFAGYLAGVVLCVGAGIVLIRPIADIPVFAFDPDNSSGFASEEESSSQQASELSSEEESSGGQATVDYKEIEIKTETEVVSKGSETAKKEDALYPGHSTKPGGGNDTGAEPVAPGKPESSAAGSSPTSSDLSSASSDTSTASSNSYLSPAVRQKEQSMVWMFHIIRETLIGTQSKIPVLNSCLFGWVTAVTAQGSSVWTTSFTNT